MKYCRMLVLVAGTLLGLGMPDALYGQMGRIARETGVRQKSPVFVSLREHHAQLPILRRVVAIELRTVPLAAALERVAASSGLRLTYSANILPDRLVSLDARRITAADALLVVLADTRLDILISTDGDAVVVPCVRGICG